MGRADKGWGGTAEGLLVLSDVDEIAGEFFGEVFQEFLSESILFFAARGERQKDLGEGLEVAPAINGFLYLLHAEPFVAVNAAEPKHEARRPGERADDVIGAAGSDIGVEGVRALLEEQFGVDVRFFQVLQRVEMFFQEHAVGVGFHAGSEREDIETFRIARVFLETLKRECARLGNGGLKALDAAGVGLCR